jgi:hypothetical protein
MSRRLDRLEEELGLELMPSVSEEDLGPATLEDLLQEVVANVRFRWAECLAKPAKPLSDYCRPVERIGESRWAHLLWRPERSRRELPASDDLYLESWQPVDGFHRARIPEDRDALVRYEQEQWRVCDVWTGRTLCEPWEWRFFARLLDRTPRAVLLSIEPRPRPYDWHHPPPAYEETFIPRSAYARYLRGLKEDA